MNRKSFIEICGLSCIGAISLSTLLQSCSSVKILNVNIVGTDLILPLNEFEKDKENPVSYEKYIILHNDKLQYPICVYRFSENDYIALWMKCTHQGTELQAFGSKLQCPAHGSEFSNKGIVQNGPADQPLKTFPITIEKNLLIISLK